LYLVIPASAAPSLWNKASVIIYCFSLPPFPIVLYLGPLPQAVAKTGPTVTKEPLFLSDLVPDGFSLFHLSNFWVMLRQLSHMDPEVRGTGLVGWSGDCMCGF